MVRLPDRVHNYARDYTLWRRAGGRGFFTLAANYHIHPVLALVIRIRVDYYLWRLRNGR